MGSLSLSASILSCLRKSVQLPYWVRARLFATHAHTQAASYWTRLISYPLSAVTSILTNLPILTVKLWPYLVVVICFVTFVVKNGSIVVGDKSHHVASFHVPQLFYFVIFSCAMAAPFFLFNLRLMAGFLKVLLTRKRWMSAYVCLLGLTAMAVHYYTYVWIVHALASYPGSSQLFSVVREN